ncbi:glutaredoxin domain-containing protein [Methylorubrum extorquens]|uniref:glutaredoxin domain-containing protein n=1 Tax=Methylorubrum extorquens TaxID=408 RepID=UPI0035D037F7
MPGRADRGPAPADHDSRGHAADQASPLIVDDGTITHTFYPVFPPDRATADVVAWLRDHPTDDLGEKTGAVIYTTVLCPHCRTAKALLTAKGVAFTEIDVERDQTAATAMVARSGRKTIPQVFAGGRYLGGADDLQALDLRDSSARCSPRRPSMRPPYAYAVPDSSGRLETSALSRTRTSQPGPMGVRAFARGVRLLRARAWRPARS